MNYEPDLLIMRTFGAQLKDVWDFLTVHTKMWWPGMSFEPVVGASVHEVWQEVYGPREATGTVEKVYAPYDLTFKWTQENWINSGHQQYLTVNFQLTSHAGKTVMTVRERGFESVAITPNRVEMLREEHRTSWTQLLNNLSIVMASPEGKIATITGASAKSPADNASPLGAATTALSSGADTTTAAGMDRASGKNSSEGSVLASNGSFVEDSTNGSQQAVAPVTANANNASTHAGSTYVGTSNTVAPTARQSSAAHNQVDLPEAQAAAMLAQSVMNLLAAKTSAPQLDVAQVISEIAGGTKSAPRLVIGITGAPGAGKSTQATKIAEILNNQNIRTAVLPMDGFHLSNAQLKRLGLSLVKGAPETFDAAGFAFALRRVAQGTEDVFVPVFHREIEESFAADGLVPASAQVVLVEGNYLLLDESHFGQVKSLLTEAWYLQPDEQTRVDRLVMRHVSHGKSPQAAIDWALGPDQKNAEKISATKTRAHLVINLS